MLEQSPLGGWDDDWHGQIREDPDDHNSVMERIGYGGELIATNWRFDAPDGPAPQSVTLKGPAKTEQWDHMSA
jgi:hypothetical protein